MSGTLCNTTLCENTLQSFSEKKKSKFDSAQVCMPSDDADDARKTMEGWTVL